jgi:hypothetical protein
MFASLEKFSQTYEHTIAMVGAVGTVLAGFATVVAVLVSLYLARRSESVRIKAFFCVSLSNTVPTIQYASINITNVGLRAT